jgi:hypothetical protein
MEKLKEQRYFVAIRGRAALCVSAPDRVPEGGCMHIIMADKAETARRKALWEHKDGVCGHKIVEAACQ